MLSKSKTENVVILRTHETKVQFMNQNSIDVRGPHVTPELNNELQCNVGNMWEKFTLYLYALKTA